MLEYGIFYSSSKEFKLGGYCYNDWTSDDDRKVQLGLFFSWKFCIYMEYQEAIVSFVNK